MLGGNDLANFGGESLTLAREVEDNGRLKFEWRNGLRTSDSVPALSQIADEFIGRDTRLLEYSRERADLQLPMVRDAATGRIATHHDVASTWSGDNEAEALQRANRLGAGYARKARHSPPLETS